MTGRTSTTRPCIRGYGTNQEDNRRVVRGRCGSDSHAGRSDAIDAIEAAGADAGADAGPAHAGCGRRQGGHPARG
jgi:hypothetical protein